MEGKAKAVAAVADQQRSSWSAQEKPASTNPVASLSRTQDNQAVQRMLRAGGIQAKLEVNQPDGPDERQADQIAARVTAMPKPSPSIQRACACGAPVVAGGECAACRAKRLGIQRKQSSSVRLSSSHSSHQQALTSGRTRTPTNSAALPESVTQTLNSTGQPLDAATRAELQPHFGAPLDKVRVHIDTKAAGSAQAIQAHAYTHGSQIVFGPGQYAPTSAAGRQLLAHELAHVDQQAGVEPRIQRQPKKDAPKSQPTKGDPPKKEVNWKPGMLARITKEYNVGDPFTGYEIHKVGEIIEILEEPAHFYKETDVLFVLAELPGRPKGTSPRYINVTTIEPVDRSQIPTVSPSSQVETQFKVDVMNAYDFQKVTGIDPMTLPENAMIPLDQARAASRNSSPFYSPFSSLYSSPLYASQYPASRPDDNPWNTGISPGAGFGMASARWPAFPLPEFATGVQWTQSKFGHLSQFSNIPGRPTIGGFRSWGPIHGYQGIKSGITGEPWTKPVMGRYWNDWWFRLFPPKNQTLVYRTGTPQHAELVSQLIKRGEYYDPYTFPPVAEGTSCRNCITVPRSQEFGALGGRPVMVTEDGVFDITEYGRSKAGEPFTVEQAGRGTTMREWLKNPKVQTPTGEIETLNVSRVPASTVWGARGVTCIRAGGIVLLLYGAYNTTKRLSEASGTPQFGRVLAQETGSWVGGIIGGALGAAAAGAIACSPTGPGAFVCAAAGFVGGLVIGTLGSMAGALGGDYLYDKLSGPLGEAAQTANEVFSPMIERAIWGDKPIREMGYYPRRQYFENPYEYEQDKARYMSGQGGR